CNEACGETCRSCRHAETGVPDGRCAFTVAGRAHPACHDDGPDACGSTGLCGEGGVCAKVPDATPCRQGGRRQGGARVAALSCDGAPPLRGGTGTHADCSPSRCGPSSSACSESCPSTRECAGGFGCSPAGRCEAALAPDAANAGCVMVRPAELHLG